MKVTTDMIVGIGLVVALNMNIALGGDTQVTMNISTGLVGFIGKVMLTAASSISSESKEKEKEKEDKAE